MMTLGLSGLWSGYFLPLYFIDSLSMPFYAPFLVISIALPLIETVE